MRSGPALLAFAVAKGSLRSVDGAATAGRARAKGFLSPSEDAVGPALLAFAVAKGSLRPDGAATAGPAASVTRIKTASI